MTKKDNNPHECQVCHGIDTYLAANGFWLCNDCKMKEQTEVKKDEVV